MSAIAGIWHFDGFQAADDVGAMLGGLALYGKDVPTIWASGPVAMGRWLFPTVPEDRFDRQPCAMRDGQAQLIADVRLDNRSEVAAILGLTPPEAAIQADSALLARLWERRGPDCLNDLVGDYALAVWDNRDQSLILARDPMGNRPLFYHSTDKLIAFSSMPSGLFALPAIPCALDEDHLIQAALVKSGRSARSFFKEISHVQSGEYINISPKGVRHTRFWEPKHIPKLRFRNPDDYAAALREALDSGVASQLRGCGEVATQLSGGLDSSCVTASAARLLAQEGRRLLAFTSAPRPGYALAAPAGRIIDESGHAAAVAALYPNIDHIIHGSGNCTPFDALQNAVGLFQQPLLNLCNQMWMEEGWRRASESGATVLLTGALGNGSISYRDTEALRESARRGQWKATAGDAAGLVAGGHATWPGIASVLLGRSIPARLRKLLRRAAGRVDPELTDYLAINPVLLKSLDASVTEDLDAPVGYGQDIRWLILNSVDLGASNKGVLAGWGVDQRHPAIDRRVVETCLAMPQREYIRGGIPASVYRRAFAKRLPAELLEEKARGLQGADWHEALAAGRSKLMAELTCIERDELAGRTLDLPRMRRSAENLPDSGEEYLARSAELRLMLLRGVALGHFIRRVREGRSAFQADQIKLLQPLD